MSENEISGSECDIDDILCQIVALTHLKGLKDALGEEKFRTEFPEFEELSQKLPERIASRETSIREALKRCGLPPVEETEPETILVKPDVITGGEEQEE